MSHPDIPSNRLNAQEFPEKTAYLQQIAELSPDLLFVIALREQKIIYVNKKVKGRDTSLTLSVEFSFIPLKICTSG